MRFNSKFHFSLLMAVAILSVWSACTKEEERYLHSDYVHTGIETPPYNGIPQRIVENYVNKIYIDLIGQKPTETERDDAVNYLMGNGLTVVAREKVITDVLASDGYKDRLFQINSDLLLNGMSIEDISNVIVEYTAIRDLVLLQGDTLLGQLFQYELNKLSDLQSAPDDFENGQITLSAYFGIMVYNLVYDEINMGSENFVISCFENLFKRQPTNTEQANGVGMVDGTPTSVLLRQGKTKTEFIAIITEDNEFYQGRVLDAYNSLLLRPPTSEELAKATEKFKNSGSLKDMQKDIVKTDEYAGFD